MGNLCGGPPKKIVGKVKIFFSRNCISTCCVQHKHMECPEDVKPAVESKAAAESMELDDESSTELSDDSDDEEVQQWAASVASQPSLIECSSSSAMSMSSATSQPPSAPAQLCTIEETVSSIPALSLQTATSPMDMTSTSNSTTATESLEAKLLSTAATSQSSLSSKKDDSSWCLWSKTQSSTTLPCQKCPGCALARCCRNIKGDPRVSVTMPQPLRFGEYRKLLLERIPSSRARLVQTRQPPGTGSSASVESTLQEIFSTRLPSSTSE